MYFKLLHTVLLFYQEIKIQKRGTWVRLFCVLKYIKLLIIDIIEDVLKISKIKPTRLSVI